MISSIETDAAKFNLDRRRVPAVALWLGITTGDHGVEPAKRRQSRQREPDRRSISQAGRAAHAISPWSGRRVHAIERRVSPKSQERLSRRRRPGDRAVGAKRRLDAATHAERLEPESEEPRNLVKHCRVRLDKILSKQRQSANAASQTEHHGSVLITLAVSARAVAQQKQGSRDQSE